VSDELVRPDSLHVAVLVPSMGTVPIQFAFDLTRAVAHFTATSRHKLSVDYAMSSILPKARQDLVYRAQGIGADTTIWLDSDMRFPPDVFTRLLASDEHAIVGCNYSRRKLPLASTTYSELGPDGIELMPPGYRDGVVEVGAVGLGCVRIDTAVFDRIPAPHFAFVWGDNSGKWNGEDISFCLKARDAGVPVMCDTELSHEIGHVGQYTYTLEDAWRSTPSED